MSKPNREKVYTWLTELMCIVLCGRVPVILFYGLPNVKMVGESKGLRVNSLPG